MEKTGAKCEMILNERRNYVFPAVIGLVVLAGLVLRFLDIPFRALEYDEIWTMNHYSAIPVLSVFSDLATPNNHPLNTLLVRLFTKCFGYQFTIIRLPAFLFGTGTIFLAMKITWETLRRKDAVLFTAVCMSFHGFLLFYSASARGYSAQTFFVLLSAYALFRLYRGDKQTPMPALVFLFSGILCCLSITSGLIFVCALCGTFVLLNIRKEKLSVALRENGFFIAAAVLFCLFAGLWYGMNFGKIQEGQAFGTVLDAPEKIWNFLSGILFHLLLFPFLAVHAAALLLRKNPFRRVSAAFLIFAGFVFLSAFLTKAGPARVYLPLVPLAIVSSAAAVSGIAEALNLGKMLSSLYLLIALIPAAFAPSMLRDLRPPDWIRLSRELIRDVPPEIFVNFSSMDSYPVGGNFPQAKEDMFRRLCSPELKGFLQVDSSGNIELYDSPGKRPVSIKKASSRQFKSSDGTLMELYELKKFSVFDPVKGKVLLLAVSPVPREEFRISFRELGSTGEKWYLTNLFLNRSFSSFGGVELKAAAYVCPEAMFDADYYLKISSRHNGRLKFYLLQ